MEAQPRDVQIYQTEYEHKPYQEWLDGLKDKKGVAAIDANISAAPIVDRGDRVIGRRAGAHGKIGGRGAACAGVELAVGWEAAGPEARAKFDQHGGVRS